MSLTSGQLLGPLHIFQGPVTAAANAGNVTVATVMVAPVVILWVSLKAVTAAPAAFTNGQIEGLATSTQAYINNTSAALALLNAADKFVRMDTSNFYGTLAPGEVVQQNLNGTGAAAVDFLITIGYYPSESGGYLV